MVTREKRTLPLGPLFPCHMLNFYQIEMRSATVFSGGHTDDVDHIAWNPTHPDLFCTSSQKDRRIVFWDARRGCTSITPYKFDCSICGSESRYVQQLPLKNTSPAVQMNYSPDGRVLLYSTSVKYMHYLTYGKEGDETKEQWHSNDREVRCFSSNIVGIVFMLFMRCPAYCFDRLIQPLWRWHCNHAPIRAKYPPSGVPEL